MVQNSSNSSTLLQSPFFIKYSLLVFAEQNDPGPVQLQHWQRSEWQLLNDFQLISLITFQSIAVATSGSWGKTPHEISRFLLLCFLRAGSVATIHFSIYSIPLNNFSRSQEVPACFGVLWKDGAGYWGASLICSLVVRMELKPLLYKSWASVGQYRIRESQNISSWKELVRIFQSKSLLLTGVTLPPCPLTLTEGESEAGWHWPDTF